MVKQPRIDLTIDGHGFYQITACTTRADRFMRRVQGNDRGTAYSDDSRMTANIADGAIDAGLVVTVNGKAYGGSK
jgi:hypothetical protein